MQVVEIELREIYGETKAYPANNNARLFAELLNVKTLTHAKLCLIERLGFAICTRQKELKI
jgi:hypothetical protein